MKHVYWKDVKADYPSDERMKDVSIRWLITKSDGAKNFAMRFFEIAPGGYSPWHNHEWEHEMFILEGEGVAVKADGEIPFKPGDAFFIEPGEQHNFKNTGNKPLRFLCLIPYLKKDK